jgi:hypothetical protein
MRHTTLSAFVMAVAASAAGPTAAQQTRDNRPPAPGTGSISGIVVTADAIAAPVRHATVEVAGVQMLTDDDGRFMFSRLPASTYFVVAHKAGFLPASFGEKRPLGQGVGLDLREGQPLSDIRVKLFRGGVLAGAVMEPSGRAAAGVEVRAFRDGIDEITGQRLPLPVTIGVGLATTDDKGQYRLYGLAPGDYVVSAAGPPGVSAIRVTTEADVRYATQILQIPAGVPIDSSIRRAAPSMARAEGVGVPTYFPSADSVSEAPRVTLGLSEERQGVDVIRRRVPAGSISGNVAGPFAKIREGGKVHIIDKASPFTATVPWQVEDGRFGFGGVPPGQYDVIAMSESGGFLGRSEAFVSGSPVVLAVYLQAGAAVSGRLVFQTTTGQPPDPSLVSLWLAPASRADFPFRQTPLKADGTFRWAGVPTGSYRLVVSTAANVQPGWRVKSATVGGLELLDNVFDIRSAAPGEIIVTLTDARSAITGTLQAPDGTPVNDYSVLAFAADSKFWRPASRRTQIVRPNSSGMFALRDLPEGDYLIVALDDVEAGQWHRAEFLAELAPYAIKVSLADGEKKVQDIRINGGSPR